MTYKFFRWRAGCILFMLDGFAKLPPNVRMGARRDGPAIPWVSLYHLYPRMDPDNVVGYVFRTHPRAAVKMTSAFVHIGNPGGSYEHCCGMFGVQVYTGDDDTMLVSAAVDDAYTIKVEADIIV